MFLRTKFNPAGQIAKQQCSTDNKELRHDSSSVMFAKPSSIMRFAFVYKFVNEELKITVKKDKERYKETRNCT